MHTDICGRYCLRLIVTACFVTALSAEAEDIKPLPWVEGSTTLAVLPDTQYYAEKYPHLFEAQTRWIADNREKRNIAYVLHLGDITEHNIAKEWEVAKRSFRMLDGKVPYALLPGNHDYSDGRKTMLSQYFPVAEFKKWPTYGGVFEEGKLDNSFHLFRIGQRDWIVIALEYGPRDETLSWANAVLDRYPDRLAIIVTHAYLFRDSTRFDGKSGKKQRGNPYGFGNDGEQMWQKLARRHAGVMLVLSGHVADGGLGYRSDTGDRGNIVHQMMVDYQKSKKGGEAFLRLLEFLPDGKTVQARSYSPALDRYKIDLQNQFRFTLKLAAEGPRAKENDSLTETDRKAIAWFDTLDYPDLAKKPFVRVATGSCFQSGDDPPRNWYRLGFLLAERGEEFTIFTPDRLVTQTYRRTPPGTPEHERVAYSVQNLKDFAAAQLGQQRDVHLHCGPTEMFLLGRACAVNGLEPLAHDLIAEARKAQQFPSIEGPTDLVAKLSQEIAYNRMWDAVVAFEKPTITRKDLLERFRYIAKHFPTSEYAARAKETADLLEQMIKEDDRHSRQAVKPLNKLPTKERVAELIFQLRDQNGQQCSQPGACDIFDDPRGERSPTHQLVAMGFDAVPQLIDAVDDRRFTRSVGFHRDFCFSHHVLRVGDCAKDIVQRIAGRSFSATLPLDGHEAEVKKEIRKWWEVAQTKGEKQILIDAVVRGTWEATQQAEQLVKKYPRDALNPLVAAAKISSEGCLRGQFVRIAGQIPGDASTRYLLGEMEESPAIESRVSAAWELLERGRPEAVPAMIALWDSFTARFLADEKTGHVHRDQWGPDYAGTLEVMWFLERCGSPAAIDTLRKHMNIHGIYRRIAIIEAFDRSKDSDLLASNARGGLRPGESAVSWKAEVEKAVERLLISATSDTEQLEGMWHSWDDKWLQDPRVCDIAAYLLAQRLPKKYSFDLAASRPQQDRQRLTMINAWRTVQHLPLMSLPAPKRIAPTPASTTSPLLAKVIEAKSAAERKTAIAELQKLGLPALPAVRQRLANLGAKHAARADLESLAALLASIVNEVEFVEGSASPPETLRRRLAESKGKPLTGKAYLAILWAANGDLSAGSTGIRLWAIRDGDDTGVTLRVKLTEWYPIGGNCATSESVTIDHKTIYMSGGGAYFQYVKTEEAHREMIRSVDAAVAAAPHTPFMIRATLVKDRPDTP
jgi:3',5'-cyclic AMP phosphodiesterase CpdA